MALAPPELVRAAGEVRVFAFDPHQFMGGLAPEPRHESCIREPRRLLPVGLLDNVAFGRYSRVEARLECWD